MAQISYSIQTTCEIGLVAGNGYNYSYGILAIHRVVSAIVDDFITLKNKKIKMHENKLETSFIIAYTADIYFSATDSDIGTTVI